MNIRDYIKKNIDANFDGNLPFKTYCKEVEKDHIITEYNQTETEVYFLKSGIIIVLIMEKEDEKILDFIFENSFFASYNSLLSGQPSDVSIKAYTNCELEVINYQELKETYNYSLISNKLGRIETEQLYRKKVLREKELLTKTAEDRYISLIHNYPEIIKRIPVKDISKYLGIKPESLSRIRKKINFLT